MNELMLERNPELFEIISKWRCVTTVDLKKLVAENESYSAFRQRVVRLEKGGLLKSILYKGFNKIVYPSNDLVQKLGLSSFNADNVRHDAVVSSICSELLNHKIVKEIELPHEYKTKSTWRFKSIEPDAIVTLEKNGNVNYMAVEVELWRKDKKRIFEKFTDYAKAKEYSYVFYFFQSQSAFNSYKKRLEEYLADSDLLHLHLDLEQKIVLVFNATISKRLSNLSESEIFYKKQFKKFKDLLGVRSDS
jgi:hypothetical protein